jgi:hypothetical protein
LVKDDEHFVNQNDYWHGIKGVGKDVTALGKGAKKRHNVTWHEQLTDKVQPICTHFNWAMMHCDGDAEKLQLSRSNVVQH